MRIECHLEDQDKAIAFQAMEEKIHRLLKQKDVQFTCRGGLIVLQGKNEAQLQGLKKLFYELSDKELVKKLESFEQKKPLKSNGDVGFCVSPSGKAIKPRTKGQGEFMQKALQNTVTIVTGPAGTGKTFLSVAAALHRFHQGDISRIILCRPAVEAGENLGFLPGTFLEKINPYLRPLYDALHAMLTPLLTRQMIEQETIEVVPLAFMRGRNLSKAMMILDEAQNTTLGQIKMFLTRLGEGSSAIISGDTTQIDLLKKSQSGLIKAESILSDINDIATHRFSVHDVVRHPLVGKIVKAFSSFEKKSGKKKHKS